MQAPFTGIQYSQHNLIQIHQNTKRAPISDRFFRTLMVSIETQTCPLQIGGRFLAKVPKAKQKIAAISRKPVGQDAILFVAPLKLRQWQSRPMKSSTQKPSLKKEPRR